MPRTRKSSLCQIHGEKLEEIGENVAVILALLKGNGSEGLASKVARHDKYFYMITGGAILISVVWGFVKAFV